MPSCPTMLFCFVVCTVLCVFICAIYASFFADIAFLANADFNNNNDVTLLFMLRVNLHGKSG